MPSNSVLGHAPILVFRRVLKLVANASKLFCYGFYFFFPRSRFVILKKAAPLIQSETKNRIPKIVWQTSFSNRVTLPIYINYLFNRIMAPSYEFRFFDDSDIEGFLKEHCSDTEQHAYQQLQVGAAKADLWRVLILEKFGGFYLDLDAHFVWPPTYVNESTSEVFMQIKTGEITNYFLASAPANPKLTKVKEKIIENIRNQSSDNVYNLTGPGVFNEVLDISALNIRNYSVTCNQGNFTNEYFQYLDKPGGKWTIEQTKLGALKKRGGS